jgi:hypothetical protein
VCHRQAVSEVAYILDSDKIDFKDAMVYLGSKPDQKKAVSFMVSDEEDKYFSSQNLTADFI